MNYHYIKQKLNESCDGIEFVALTSKPAINVNFLRFNDSLQFSADEEKRVITGPNYVG